MNTNSKLALTLAIFGSLAWLGLWCLVYLGYDIGVEAGLVDSRGNRLGFNNLVTREHFWTLARLGAETGIVHVLKQSVYSILCGVMHLAAIWVVWSATFSRRARTVFFALQPVFFPLCVFGSFGWASVLASVEALDGETMCDFPQIVVAGAPWILVSYVCLFAEAICFPIRSPDPASQPPPAPIA